MTEHTTPDTTDLKARLPAFGYAYRYPEGEAVVSVIRFDTGGCSINGSRPTEVIELCRLDEAAAALDAKDRTIERLREALKPFARLAANLAPNMPDDACHFVSGLTGDYFIVASQLRRAAEVLKGQTP